MNNGSATDDVSLFMAQLEHPFKAQINRLRTLILAIRPDICEEIKWNAPSYKLTEHFATFKLFPATQLQLVLHRGAKTQFDGRQFALNDRHKLLKWPAPDRCVLSLKSPEQAVEHEQEIINIVEQWIRQL